MIQLKELISEYKKWKQYSLPSDKELLLYDFYVLSYLSTIRLSNKDVADSKIGSFVGRNEEELKDNINEIEKKLFPHLKKELLNATFFAICCEIRYINNVHTTLSYFKQNRSNPMVVRQYKIFETYVELSQDMRALFKFDKKYSNDPNVPHRHSDRIANYYTIYKLMKQLNMTRYEFVEFCKEMFSNLRWPNLYGGKSWKNICESWISLYNVPDGDLKNLQIYIDHVYDIQHNTGSVFTKVRSYYSSDTGFKWLEDALDFKANVKSPYELLKKCSSQMKKLAYESFKRAGINR